MLKWSLLATLALAPLEGYLLAVNPNLSKLAPALFLVTWVVHRVFGGRAIGTSHPVTWCALTLLVLVLASAAVNLDNGWALVYTVRWAPFLVLTVAMVDVLTHDVHPWAALAAFLTGAASCGVGALVSFLFLGDARATGPLDDPNDLAYVLTAAVPVAIVALVHLKDSRWKLLAAPALLVLVLGAAATLSRGGAIAVTVVLLWALARRLVRVRTAALCAVLLALAAVPAFDLVRNVIDGALAQKQYIASTNIETRQLRWLAAARMMGDHPLLGVGPGGFRTGYVSYGRLAELDALTPVAHEMYLEVGAELGVIALLVFLAAIAAGFLASEAAVRNRGADSAGRRDRLRLAALAAQGSLLAVCTSSIFLSEEYYMPLWAALAITAAVHRRSEGGAREGLARHRRDGDGWSGVAGGGDGPART
ncbi:O-antigen ligase [Kineococcus rhizosphaerae]|uniref:O-antigen ligase n=1 Tax=Kineococcus rhizosphaerae TaxID=559628 RepID=A0A2T0RBA4_9ACTN|nr:O-antigen ligase [Kineococcus rhizosphaerae]